MKNQFTQGEWHAGFKDFTNDFEVPYIEIKSGYKLIAKATYGETTKERAANAKLIAAAPDLLKACENIMWAHSQLIKEGFYSEVEEIREAIKKATE